MLLELHQLDERLTNLPIFLSDFKVLVRRLIHSSFFLELHVHLSNPIDWVSFLPNNFQVSLTNQSALTMARHKTIRITILPKLILCQNNIGSSTNFSVSLIKLHQIVNIKIVIEQYLLVSLVSLVCHWFQIGIDLIRLSNNHVIEWKLLGRPGRKRMCLVVDFRDVWLVQVGFLWIREISCHWLLTLSHSCWVVNHYLLLRFDMLAFVFYSICWLGWLALLTQLGSMYSLICLFLVVTLQFLRMFSISINLKSYILGFVFTSVWRMIRVIVVCIPT